MGINFKLKNLIKKMAAPFNSLDETTHDQMGCTFAALLLHDEGIEVNNANLKKTIEASGNKVAGYWPMLFANALAGRNVGDFLAVSGGSAPVQQSTGGAPAQNETAAAPKEEEAPAEEEEEDMDLVIFSVK